jgi:alpha-tubulin suppressor-like RCC1 family protein
VQLGTGEATTASRSSPITVFGGGTTWKTIACGYSHTAAVKTDGTLWTWGANTAGQLGDGTTVNKSTPILVTTMSGGWKSVAASGDTTANSGVTLATMLFTG